jgi:hypothetical protein
MYSDVVQERIKSSYYDLWPTIKLSFLYYISVSTVGYRLLSWSCSLFSLITGDFASAMKWCRMSEHPPPPPPSLFLLVWWVNLLDFLFSSLTFIISWRFKIGHQSTWRCQAQIVLRLHDSRYVKYASCFLSLSFLSLSYVLTDCRCFLLLTQPVLRNHNYFLRFRFRNTVRTAVAVDPSVVELHVVVPDVMASLL